MYLFLQKRPHHPESRETIRHRGNQHGFTLIELMVALLLGILVVIAVTSVFMSGRRSYGTTQGLNRIQENQRVAFEMMAADIRSAGSYICPGLTDPIWQVGTDGPDWPEARFMLAVGLEGNGYFGDPLSKKDDDSGVFDSIVLSMDSAVTAIAGKGEKHFYPIESHKTPKESLRLHDSIAGLSGLERKHLGDDQYLAVCNIDVAIVFGTKASKFTGNIITVTPGTEAGNLCGNGFARNPVDNCAANPEPGYCFWGNLTGTGGEPTESEKQTCGEWSSSQAFVVNLADYRPDSAYVNAWYVDNTDEKGRLMNPVRGGAIIEGVTGLQLRYRLRGSDAYVDANTIRNSSPEFEFKERKGAGEGRKSSLSHKFASNWSKVDSVYLKMSFKSPEEIKGTDGELLKRTMETYIAVRSHILEY